MILFIYALNACMEVEALTDVQRQLVLPSRNMQTTMLDIFLYLVLASMEQNTA